MRIPPKTTFYLSQGIENNDDTFDLDVEGNKSFLTLGDALTHASESVSDHGGTMTVYECRPIKVLRRVAVQIEDVYAPHGYPVETAATPAVARPDDDDLRAQAAAQLGQRTTQCGTCGAVVAVGRCQCPD